MKRAGGLIERIADWKNVCNAYGRAIRHKSRRPEVINFKRKAKSRLWRIRQNILSGRFCLGRYWHFTIFDPKEREIYAAPLRQRIIHQAFIGVLGRYLERPLIADTYACRRGFGQWKAVYRAYGMARRFPWGLKLDIRHYFDSIDHEIMYGMLERLFKDKHKGFKNKATASFGAAAGTTMPETAVRPTATTTLPTTTTTTTGRGWS